MGILSLNYKNWNLYYSKKNKEGIKLGKKIIDNNYIVEQILKEGKRNYVAIVSIDNKKFILKEFRSEVNIPQRQIQTYIKKGEAVTTLKNGLESIDEGLMELVRPIVALVKREKIIKKSYLLMEYIEGKKLMTKEDIDKVIILAKKIHKLKRYHGDLNTSNFIKVGEELKILDTQMKREKILNFRKNYDILTLKEDLLVINLNYDINKEYIINKLTFSYILAFILKRVKKTKCIKKLREYKKKLREKGWKI